MEHLGSALCCLCGCARTVEAAAIKEMRVWVYMLKSEGMD
jgi:hypothetical protein